MGSGAPVTSSRLNATPEPDVSPLLPNTICWTLTAVPQSSGMRLMRRYWHGPLAHPRVEHRADRLRELLARVGRKVVEALKLSVSSRSASTSSSVSSVTPRSRLTRAISSSKRSPGIPRTTLPNICTRRR